MKSLMDTGKCENIKSGDADVTRCEMLKADGLI